MTPTAIAQQRFGLGAAPGEVPPADVRDWLLAQAPRFQPRPPAWAGQQDTATLLAAYFEEQRTLRMASAEERPALQKQAQAARRSRFVAGAGARARCALGSETPFMERLVHFWANHFAISAEKGQVALLAGAYEAEAIRPHVTGRFEDMLVAAVSHPAMLYYLDQAGSIGPGSDAGRRTAERDPERRRGLNENLAREILELHTLGVRSGYTQEDVTEFARALTGWGVQGPVAPGAKRQAVAEPAPPEPGTGFVFRPQVHEPGERRLLGRRYAEGGQEQARAMLQDLAQAPATAKHIARKLARHFVADDPPAAVVDRLAEAFRRSEGDLPTVYKALVQSPEAWGTRAAKFKTPWDWALSSLLALGVRDVEGPQVAGLMRELGQPVWAPGSPAGFDDIAASWAAPDALVRRVEVAQRLAARAGGSADPRQWLARMLPDASEATVAAVTRADTHVAGLTLFLVSPEFLRR